MLLNKRDRISLYLHIYICKELKQNPYKIKIIRDNFLHLKNKNILSYGLNLWEEFVFNNELNYIFKQILQKNQKGQLLRSSSICAGVLDFDLVKNIKLKYKRLYEI